MILVKTENDHLHDVKKLQQLIRSKHTFSLAPEKNSSNTLRNGEYKKNTRSLDLSSFCSIVTLNLKSGWVAVEPRMTLKSLCKALLPLGWMPPVVPEFYSITVGGAIMGAAIESSSFRYGQFSDCCLEYEVILGDGTLVYASPDQNSDLFYGLSGSYGTLALLTLAKIQLIPAKRYVKIHYHRFHNTNALFSFFQSSQDKDFLDGVVIGKEWTVGMEGTLADSPGKLPCYSQRHFWSPWFHQHVYEKTQESSFAEAMPIEEYLFRLDRGAFWMGRYLIRFPLILQVLFQWNLTQLDDPIRRLASTLMPHEHPSFLFRLLFGWAFSSQRLYQLWHRVPLSFSEKIFFIQDFYVPFEKGEEALNHFSQKTGIFPIWLCPLKGTATPQFLSPHFQSTLMVNIGMYGIPSSPIPIPVLTQQLEQELLLFEGRKMLYSLTYYSEETFSKIYDIERYSLLRKKFHADPAFLPLYKKIANML